MSYKLKVGDTGLFNNGEYAYEVIAVDVKDLYKDQPGLVCLYWYVKDGRTGTKFPATRLSDGKHSDPGPRAQRLSLAPPKRKVWRITVKYKEKQLSSTIGWTQDYTSFEHANRIFDSHRGHHGRTVTLTEVEIDHE